MMSLVFPGSCYTQDLVCTLQKCSFCFPQSCGIPAIKPRWSSKPDSLGAPPPFPDPQAEKPDMELRTFTPVGVLLWCNYFPVCESPTRQVWDLILSELCPSYHLILASSLSLDVGYLFWWVPAFFVLLLLMVVHQLAVILVFL